MKPQPVAAPSGIPIRVSWASPSAQTAEEEADVGNTKSEPSSSALERASYTIPEICFRNHISRPKYHRLRAEGRGPAETRFGLNTIRVTAEAEREWLRRLQDEPNQDFETKAIERAMKAGGIAIKSPNHVSKRGKVSQRKSK